METIKKFKPIECPNCGAPLRSENCEYCGSYIDLGTNLQIELEIERLRKKIAYEQCQLAQASQSNQILAVTASSAVAEGIATGKCCYLASGEKVEGTATVLHANNAPYIFV